MRRFYRRCDAIVVPAESTAAIMRAQRMNKDISIWARGVDRDQFNPERRSLEWRRAHGIGDDDMVVSFLGRLVLEKGLDVFSDAIDAARAKGVPLKVVAIGDGPARGYFRGAAARRHLHRPVDRRRAGHRAGLDRRVPQPVDHRDLRQCHAGSDGVAACR